MSDVDGSLRPLLHEFFQGEVWKGSVRRGIDEQMTRLVAVIVNGDYDTLSDLGKLRGLQAQYRFLKALRDDPVKTLCPRE